MPVLHVHSKIASCLYYMCVESSSLSVLHVRNSSSINLKFASYNMYYVIYLHGPDPNWNGISLLCTLLFQDAFMECTLITFLSNIPPSPPCTLCTPCTLCSKMVFPWLSILFPFPPPLWNEMAHPLTWAGPYCVCKLELPVYKVSSMSIFHSYN